MAGINKWVWALATFVVLCAVLEGLLDGRVVWFVQLMGVLTIFAPLTIAVASVKAGRKQKTAGA